MADREEALGLLYTLGVERCSYSWGEVWAPTCDCKYGYDGSQSSSSEKNGCPELRSLYSAISVMADAEWSSLRCRADGLPASFPFSVPNNLEEMLDRPKAAAAIAASLAPDSAPVAESERLRQLMEGPPTEAVETLRKSRYTKIGATRDGMKGRYAIYFYADDENSEEICAPLDGFESVEEAGAAVDAVIVQQITATILSIADRAARQASLAAELGGIQPVGF
jgi:hypothetical protein